MRSRFPRSPSARTSGGKYVLVVGENNIVEQKYVTLGAPQEGGWSTSGKGWRATRRSSSTAWSSRGPGLPVTPLTPEQFEAMKQQAAQK